VPSLLYFSDIKEFRDGEHWQQQYNAFIIKLIERDLDWESGRSGFDFQLW
jgi:hypothetical protein